MYVSVATSSASDAEDGPATAARQSELCTLARVPQAWRLGQAKCCGWAKRLTWVLLIVGTLSIYTALHSGQDAAAPDNVGGSRQDGHGSLFETLDQQDSFSIQKASAQPDKSLRRGAAAHTGRRSRFSLDTAREWSLQTFPCRGGPLPPLWKHVGVSDRLLSVKLLTNNLAYGHELYNGSLGHFDLLGFQGCDNRAKLMTMTVPPASTYTTVSDGTSVCMAYDSWKWRLLAKGATAIAVESNSRTSPAQWVRLQRRGGNETLLFVNIHGPATASSVCGAVAVAFELASLIEAQGRPGDAVILAGAFNAHGYSPTLVALAQRLRSSVPGTNRWGFQHALSNLGPSCASEVERIGDDTLIVVLELGSTCDERDTSDAWNVSDQVQDPALAFHEAPNHDVHTAGGLVADSGPRLATLDMRSWSCRGQCLGGGCCNESDCAWACTGNPKFSSWCNSSRWTASNFTCDLFAKANATGVPRVADPGKPPLVTFYAYRAMSEDAYELENVDAANLAGVMYYLNHEVVSASCPRHYAITRILRLKVTMRSTPQVYNSGSMHPLFIGFIAFDSGTCSGPGCPELWARYGYNPGCQWVTSVSAGEYRYSKGIWYSFPGACTSHRIGDKSEACLKQEPGGWCQQPTGEPNCTWNLEPAGEVTIDELSGIENYTKFCELHQREYMLETDRGIGFNFWDERSNPSRCAARLHDAEEVFAKKYPDMPQYSDPVCVLPGMR